MIKEIHSSKLVAGNRTYFFNVKKTKTNELYLDIAETRQKPNGEYERHNILIFLDYITQFKNELNHIFKVFFEEEIQKSS